MSRAWAPVLWLIAWLWAAPSQAWGPLGHRMVGELAEQQLSAQTRSLLSDLLADEPSPRLADIAGWADDIRADPAFRWTGPLHYVNLPRGRCEYLPARDCPSGNCVVGAIERFHKALANRSLPRAERAQALKFLVHFIADVHQPLHAGFADDLGGNRYQISFDGRGTNLHAIWDGDVLKSRRLSEAAYVAELARGRMPAAGPLQAGAWAEASCRLIASAEVYPRGHKLGRDYLERQRPFAEQQIRLAAVRLAALLEAALRS